RITGHWVRFQTFDYDVASPGRYCAFGNVWPGPNLHAIFGADEKRCGCLGRSRHRRRVERRRWQPMASRDRGHSLLAWRALSCLAAHALSQRTVLLEPAVAPLSDNTPGAHAGEKKFAP